MERYQIQRIERLQKQSELAGEAADLLRNRLLIGEVSYLDFLSATQSYQRLQRDTLSARLDLILIRIGLYLAIAGDFDTRPQVVVDPSLEDQLLGELPTDQSDQALPPPDVPRRPLTRLPLDPVSVIDE